MIPMKLLLRHLRPACLLLGLLVLSAAPDAGAPPDTFVNVNRIVAVGDVHGGYDEFVAILRGARVIDEDDRWIAGHAHLVQTGDLLDRGAGSRKVMDLVMRLESQARRAGGRVHPLLGNHEVMNVAGDLRYTSAGEYAAFATRGSAEVRDRAYELIADPARKDDPAYREQWYAEHPLGWVEHRQAFGPRGRYGKWLRQLNTVVKIDGYLFLHGGIGPALATTPLRDINERVRAEIQQDVVPADGLASGRDGPLWYRGLAQGDEQELGPHVRQVLATHGVSHIVVGHTTTPGAVVPRFGGAVLLIDVGLSDYYGARQACLIVQRDEAFAFHRGHLMRLPPAGAGALVTYLRAVAALDPSPSPLDRLIALGGRLPLPAEEAPRR
jgi:hypothetical protein